MVQKVAAADRQSEAAAHQSSVSTTQSLFIWFGIIASIYILLLAVGTIGTGFKWATAGEAKKLFAFATNPFMGLIIGTMATALIQSSSTVTSIIVGLVAGGVDVSTAIPMIMGANIGTTITNTLVSLGHVRDKEEFRRAFSAATVHDFFNVMAVALFLPLEIAFSFLQTSSAWVLSVLNLNGAGMSMGGFNVVKAATKPLVTTIKDSLAVFPAAFGGTMMIVLGIALIFFSITFVGKLLKKVMVGRAKKILHAAIGRGPVTGVLSGTAVTVLVQSSSTTTSLAVPLAGSGIFTTRDIYPFTLGANIGTCITALLAATAISGPNAGVALQIALVHLIYNTLAVLVIFGIPFLREIPLKASSKLAEVGAERKSLALGYVIGVFFVVPGILVALTSL